MKGTNRRTTHELTFNRKRDLLQVRVPPSNWWVPLLPLPQNRCRLTCLRETLMEGRKGSLSYSVFPLAMKLSSKNTIVFNLLYYLCSEVAAECSSKLLHVSYKAPKAYSITHYGLHFSKDSRTRCGQAFNSLRVSHNKLQVHPKYAAGSLLKHFRVPMKALSAERAPGWHRMYSKNEVDGSEVAGDRRWAQAYLSRIIERL